MNDPTHSLADTTAEKLELAEQEQADIKSYQGATNPPPHHDSITLMPLPEIPKPNFDLEFDISSILGSSNVDSEKVQKRASNVLKLSQENEKLKAELKAISDRLEATEQRRVELARKQQVNLEAGSP